MKNYRNLPKYTLGALATGALLANSAVSADPLVDAGATIAPPAESNDGDFCDWLSDKPGIVYKDKGNPYLSEVRIFGRAHLQAAYLDGDDVNGDSFHSSYTEIRRLRLGLSTKFLRYFEFKSDANLENDRFPNGDETDHDIEYADLNSFYFTFDVEKAFDLGSFDELTLGYGKRNVRVGFEGSTSSNKIKTVERSALTNKATVQGGGQNPLGIWLEGEKDCFSFDFGVFSTDINEEIGGWNDSLFYYVGVDRDSTDWLPFKKAVIGFDYVDNQSLDAGDDDVVGEDWVGALNLEIADGAWALSTSVFTGENNGTGDRDGSFYGIVILPTYDITDKLEAVLRYQYAKSEEDEGVRLNSRYVRRDARHGGAINGGRGDEHHSIYAGLNYYFCGNNSKVLTGVEYETIDTPAGDLDATTLWFAYRMSF